MFDHSSEVVKMITMESMMLRGLLLGVSVDSKQENHFQQRAYSKFSLKTW